MDNVRPLRPQRKQASSRPSPGGTRRRVIIGIVVVVVVVLVAISSRLAGFYVDWLWFGEVGFRQVFWTRLWAQALLGLAAFAVFFAIVFPNVEIARRLAPGYRVDESGAMLEPRSETVRRWVFWGGLVVSVVVALGAGISAASRWLTVLLGLNAESFGVADPIFGRDVGFYVFSVPALSFAQRFVFAALLAALVLSALMHLIMGGIEYSARPRPRSDEDEGSPFGPPRRQPPQVPQVDVRLGGRAVAHLSAILAAIFIVAGIGQLFRAWQLLYSSAGAVFGAGATDVALRLPLTRVTMVLAFVLAALLIYNIWRRHQWWWATIVVWVLALVVLRGIVPAVYQSLVVNPNQLAKEREYLANNLTATRQAYDLSDITKRPLTQSTRLTAADLRNNETTLRNIRLWDPDTLVTSYRQLQELRPYYSFLDADVDRYTVNGVYRQTMLAARELNIDGLPAQAQTWVNQHITYTHGFGVAMSAVNQVTADGSPDFLVQDVPPRTAAGLEITEPRIYYGERGTEYTLVKTTEQEFDYPGREGDVFRRYSGDGGFLVSPVLTRLALSVRHGTIKFFTTSAITDESRVILRNNISERIATVVPFLRQDADPYMVIARGRLWWIADLYTTTDRYPYSTPEGDLNYVRNAVKVVIDAYSGSMRFYVADDDDPLIRAYGEVFPDLFEPMDTMPRDLIEHVRYPEDLFNVQSSIYATYHVSSPDVLYNKGDQWAVPEGIGSQGSVRMPAYYVIMRLPGEEQEEFLQILPFVPNGRRNMISWLGAQSDVPDYGNIVNYQFSQSTTVVGPNQVQGFIQQEPEISAQRSLWDQQGSNVILGNLLVVPIEDSLLYVQPLYLEAEDNRLPQAKRVIVFYRTPGAEDDPNAEQVVAMRNTLDEALVAAFGEAARTDVTETPDEQDGTGEPAGPSAGQGGLSAQALALIEQANRQFEASQRALRDSDFAEYGRQIEALQETLRQLQALQ
jgi:uncharacterized membrane protein (UPF0182 family)